MEGSTIAMRELRGPHPDQILCTAAARAWRDHEPGRIINGDVCFEDEVLAGASGIPLDQMRP